MRILYWGTPGFAVAPLRALLASRHTVVGLVTQPDRPRGRSARPEPPETKRVVASAGLGIPVLQPAKPTASELGERIAALAPDVSVVAAYGNLIPGRMLEVPPLGSVNLHASLLPRHRGAAPVAAAILAGDPVSGITLMQMDTGLDTGPILLQRAIPIQPAETCGMLTRRLADLAAEVALEGLSALEEGQLEPVPQDASQATYAPRVNPDDARVNWRAAAAAIERMLRAYDPWPGAFTLWEGRRLKLFRGRVANREQVATSTPPGHGAPGEVVAPAGPGSRPGGRSPEAEPGLLVRTGDGTLEIRELQLEGRPRMPAAQFLRGRRIPPGSRLG